jgi:hypothetical protein
MISNNEEPSLPALPRAPLCGRMSGIRSSDRRLVGSWKHPRHDPITKSMIEAKNTALGSLPRSRYHDRIMNLTINTVAALKIPAVVRRFFVAANRYNAEEAANCFTPGGTVHDEDRDYKGREGVLAWVAETTAKFRPMFTLLRASADGASVKLAVAVSGRFPGSPVTLGYEFQLRGRKISTLTIV